jgi:hypothetical protein
LGGITLEAIDTTLSDAADAAEKAAPGDPADAVIWDELVARTGEDSGLSVSFQVFLTIACLLAAIGAITNSPVTAVGAMVLGPEFGPLAAIVLGLVLRRADLVGRGAVALGIGFPIAMAVTALATVVFDATGLVATSRWEPASVCCAARVTADAAVGAAAGAPGWCWWLRARRCWRGPGGGRAAR